MEKRRRKCWQKLPANESSPGPTRIPPGLSSLLMFASASLSTAAPMQIRSKPTTLSPFELMMSSPFPLIIWMSAVSVIKCMVELSPCSSTTFVFHFAMEDLQCSMTSACNSTPLVLRSNRWYNDIRFSIEQCRTSASCKSKYTIVERVWSQDLGNDARDVTGSTSNVQE